MNYKTDQEDIMFLKTSHSETEAKEESIQKKVKIMLLKSEKECLENKLLRLNKQIEVQSVDKIKARLETLIESLISLKYFFLIKNYDLQDRQTVIQKKLPDMSNKLKVLSEKERAQIAKIEKKLSKKNLKLHILRKFNNRKESYLKIEILPDTTLPAMYADEKAVYYS